MSRKLFVFSAFAAAFALSACGGGGGGGYAADDGTGTTPPPPVTPPPQRATVAGPLDAVQSPVSTTVFGGLEDAAAGTPLEGVLICADYAITRDTLDIVDRLAIALQTGAANPANGPAAISAGAATMSSSVTQLANDLQGLVNALAGTGGCGAISGQPFGGAAGTNPLAGTPLAPLGDALAPVLGQVGGKSDATPASVAARAGQLNDAFQSGLLQIPSDARNAPVLGAIFSTLSVALNDLDATLNVATTFNRVQTGDRVSTLVDHLLVNVLTEVIPVTTLEAESGQGPIVSSQIITQVHSLSGALETGMAQVATPLYGTLSGQLSPLLNAIDDDVLAPILGAVSSALSGAGTDGDLFAGTPLAAFGDVLATVADGATGGVAGGTTGTPLDLILEPILDAVIAGGIGDCPVGGTPLAGLCTLADSLLDAIALDPAADPATLLTDIVDDLLGGILGLLG